MNGAVYYKPINWVDSDSGRNFYVGKQSPVEGDSFIALVDEQLPNILKDNLTEQLPKLMQYFESKLGIAKGPKPMLFASYSNKPGSSSQGGTLPDQIFMHWDFDDLDERVKSREYVYQTLWFYAHEAAHFFQKGPTGEALFGAPEHSWIHEGGAEWMAKIALSELFPDMLSYIQKKETQLQQQCEEGLTQTSLIKAADLGLFRLHYSCGYFVHRVLAADIQRTSEGKLSTFDMWLQFGDVSVKSDATSVVNFWTAVEPLIPPPRFKLLKPALENPHSTTADFWRGVSFH